MSSTFAFRKTTDTGTFARYTPFEDGRELVVRRGKTVGFHYGIERSRRKVNVDGRELELARFVSLLSPPPMHPGQQPLSAEAVKNDQPVSDVLFLPDAELLIPREPRGFTDAEVELILAAISVT